MQKQVKMRRDKISLFLAVIMLITLFSMMMSTSAMAAPTIPAEVEFIPINANWKYHDQNVDLYSTAPKFYEPSFNYSTWSENKQPLGYETGSQNSGGLFGRINDNGTVINGIASPNAIITYYFAKEIEISNYDKLTGLQSYMFIDDGVVIYFNGVEVHRDNMGEGVIGHSSISASNSAWSKIVDLSDAITLLNEGKNTIAVSVHNRDSNSSDIYFGMTLTGLYDSGNQPPTPATLSVTDVVLSPGSNESQMMFTWYTTQATGKIAVRAAGQSNFTEVEAVSVQRSSLYNHKATVSGLLPSTTYEYKFVGTGGTESDVYTFKTGNPTSFSFFAVGDPQIGSSGNVTNDTNGWKNTLNLATTNFPNASFLLSAGDQVESSSNVSQYTGYLSPDQLKNLPIVNAVGNHDSGNALFTDHYNLPNVSKFGTGATNVDYWFTYGNTLFMAIDATSTAISNHQSFMESAIAANPDVVWKVVTFHHGPYVNASHRNDGYISTMRSSWIPVFDELGIDVVINGHDHSFVRSHHMLGNVPQTDQTWLNEDKTIVENPTGTLYMELNSGSGSKHYALAAAAFFVAKQNQANRPNFSVVDVTNSSFTMTTYQVNTDNTLTIIDTYTIVKTNGGTGVAGEVIMASDKNIVKPDEYFNVSITFPAVKESNLVQIDFTFDADKFEFAGYTPADDATLLTREYGEGSASVMVMLPDYGMESLGSLMLKAKSDVGVTSSAISAIVTFVERDNNLDKTIKEAIGSYIQKTNNAGTAGYEVDLIVLSNLIDAFGLTSAHADWDNYSHFDFNGNGEIDIFDIVTVAQMIK